MKRQQGLSLIELMIAILISSLLLLGVLQLFTNTSSADRASAALGRVQESGRVLQDIIGLDARRAGYQGCSAASNTVTIGSYNFPNDAIGHASNSITFRYATLNNTGTSFASNQTCDGKPLYLLTATYSNCPTPAGLKRICKSSNGGSADPIVDNAEITAVTFAVLSGGNISWKQSSGLSNADLPDIKSVRITLQVEDTRQQISRSYSSTYEMRNRIL